MDCVSFMKIEGYSKFEDLCPSGMPSKSGFVCDCARKTHVDKDCAFTQLQTRLVSFRERLCGLAVKVDISWGTNMLWDERWESAWTPNSSQALLLLFPMATVLIFPNFCFSVLILCTVLFNTSTYSVTFQS